jgi:RNA polymerase-binding transcription factor DksA
MRQQAPQDELQYVASPDIHLREIDADHLENIEENREAIEFTVRLSSRPSDAWVQEFDQAYLQTPYTLKPPVRVYEDSLRIIYLPRYAGELQGFFRFLALIVDRSNKETHRTEELHTSSAQERHKAEFREALRRIELPRG